MKNDIDLRICEKCHAIINVLKDCTCDNCGIKCCGETMSKIYTNEVAVDNKHIPEILRIEDEMYVKLNHPMTKEHYISYVFKVRDNAIKRYTLYPEQDAELRFKYEPESTIYIYCNIHGLFKLDVE